MVNNSPPEHKKKGKHKKRLGPTSHVPRPTGFPHTWIHSIVLSLPVKSNKKLWYETPSTKNNNGTTTLEIDNIRGGPLVQKICTKKQYHKQTGAQGGAHGMV